VRERHVHRDARTCECYNATEPTLPPNTASCATLCKKSRYSGETPGGAHSIPTTLCCRVAPTITHAMRYDPAGEGWPPRPAPSSVQSVDVAEWWYLALQKGLHM
jgi:hypothetical protein